MTLRERPRVFKALGHPARLAVAERLAAGSCCVSDLQELQEPRELSGPWVSQHLLVPKSAGLIADEKRGTHIYYRLRMPCVAEISLCVCKKGSRTGTHGNLMPPLPESGFPWDSLNHPFSTALPRPTI